MQLDKDIRMIFDGDEAPVLDDMIFLGYRESIAPGESLTPGTYAPSSNSNSIDDKGHRDWDHQALPGCGRRARQEFTTGAAGSREHERTRKSC